MSGYRVTLISTQPYNHDRLCTVTVDLGGLPVPIHDFLPNTKNSVLVCNLSTEAAKQYEEIFYESVAQTIAKQYEKNCQSIIITHHANVHAVSADRVATNFGIPHIIQPHGTCIGGYQKNDRLNTETWLKISAALNNADAVVAISEYAKNTFILPFVGDHKKIYTIYNELHSKSLMVSDKRFCNHLIKKGVIQTPYLIQVGVISDWKRPTDLIEIATGIPEIQIVFVGAIKEENIAKTIRRTPNAVLLEPQYGSKRNALIQGAEFLVVSSLEEPLGYTPLEANALGVPAVARPGGAIPEFIKDGVNGYMATDQSIGAYAEAIRRGLNSPPRLTGSKLIYETLIRFGPTKTTQ